MGIAGRIWASNGLPSMDACIFIEKSHAEVIWHNANYLLSDKIFRIFSRVQHR